MSTPPTIRFAALFAGLFLAFSMMATDHAEARRGGSFGSRGARTFQAPPPTRTAPARTAPVERSMTPSTGINAASRQQPAAGTQRSGFMNGFGGSMMPGLLLGGLLGVLLGQGFGGLAGMFGFLVQALLIGGAIMLAIRFFRSQSARAPAMAGADRDYATAALRYSSLDVTRDRDTGKIVEGDAGQPTETTELWTFTRQNGAEWKLSAIQQA